MSLILMMDGIKRSKSIRYPNKYYLIVGLIIAGLIYVQLYWIVHAINLQKSSLEKSLKENLATVLKQVEESSYCFNFFSRAYIKGGQQIAIILQNKKNGSIDTANLYSVNTYTYGTPAFVNKKVLGFDSAAEVDIALKFKSTILNPKILTDTNAYMLTHIGSDNYKKLLQADNKIETLIDPLLLDSLIKNELRKLNLDTAYEAGIKRSGDTRYDYVKNGSSIRDLNNSPIKIRFLYDDLGKSYEFSMFIPNSFQYSIRTLSAMMYSSMLIVIILIISYAYFVRTIMNQKKLSEMKNIFINNITHALNTPITNISLALENWRYATKNDDFHIGIIEEENDHLRRNVEQILKLATIENNNDNKYFNPFDLNRLIIETVSSFEIQLAVSGGSINLNLSSYTIRLNGDRQHIKNLLHNLIDNAIKYKNGPPEIDINTYQNNNEVIIEIEDNGLGMTTEVQKHIFDRFYRGNETHSNNIKGFGLGLSYVKYIANIHSARVKVKSQKGVGTKFSISFPQKINKYGKYIVSRG